jgi:predicted nucleic acid-binding protein
MAWCFEDEANSSADAVLSAMPDAQVWVPAIWPLEVANVLVVAERRARLSKTDTARFVSLLGELPITTDEEAPRQAFGEILSVARRQKLSTYDAAYLELALRRNLPLATLDARLKAAARSLRVSTRI